MKPCKKKGKPNIGQTNKEKSDKAKKVNGGNANSCTKQKTSCTNKQKKVSIESRQNQDATGRLLAYRKKDLSEVNYFIPNKNNKLQQKTTEETLLPELRQNAAPSQSFWKGSIDELASDFKQIMIEEQNKQLLYQHPKDYIEFNRKLNDANRLKEKKSGREISWNSNKSDTNKINAAELGNSLTENCDRKYSLNDRSGLYRTSSYLSEEWLQDNEICLDQIIIEEKIKRNVGTKNNFQPSSEYFEPTNDFSGLHRTSTPLPETKKCKETKGQTVMNNPWKPINSYEDRQYSSTAAQVRLDGNTRGSKTLSTINALEEAALKRRHEQIKYSSEEWLQENEICLDQIIIEEKIKRNLGTKNEPQPSSENNYFKTTNDISGLYQASTPLAENKKSKETKGQTAPSNPWKQINWDEDTQYYSTAAHVCLDQIMINEKIKRKTEVDYTRRSTPLSTTNALAVAELKRRQQQITQSLSFSDTTQFSQNMPPRRLQSDCASNLSEEKIKHNLGTNNYFQPYSEYNYFEPTNAFYGLYRTPTLPFPDTRENKTLNTTNTLAGVELKRRHEQIIQSLSLSDKTQFSQNMPSRRLQSDCASNLSEKNIKRNLGTNNYFQPYSEYNYFEPTNAFSGLYRTSTLPLPDKKKTKETKGQTAISNPWKQMYSDEDNRYFSTAPCLDQIMTNQKIKSKPEVDYTRENKTLNTTNASAEVELKRRHEQIVQYFKSYSDKTQFSQKDKNMLSKFSKMLQSDSASNLLGEKITSNLGIKNYSQPYSGINCKAKTMKIIKMPTFTNALISEFRLFNEYNISQSGKPYVLSKLDTFSEEYLNVSGLFFKSVYNYRIDCVKKVVNPYLLLQYTLRKSTSLISQEEKLLFHGTKFEYLDSICTDNFNWRLVEKHKYGWGVSFSNSAYYASHYSEPSALNRNGSVMFVVKVLVGPKRRGNDSIEVPKEPFDTTISLDEKVYVKFDDCCFYPAYVIFYKDDY